MKIKVVKKKYVLARRKKSWLFRDKAFILYEVSCQLGDAFPEVMKEVFKGVYIMPRLLSKLISEENQINAVVTAYLDIHIDKFDGTIPRQKRVTHGVTCLPISVMGIGR